MRFERRRILCILLLISLLIGPEAGCKWTSPKPTPIIETPITTPPGEGATPTPAPEPTAAPTVFPLPSPPTAPSVEPQLPSLGRSLVDPDQRPDNGTAIGDFVPGFEGHIRAIETALAVNRDELLPFDHYFRNHEIGTDVATHAAAVQTVDFESRGRGGLDFELKRTYSALEHYRRSSLEELADYLHPYYAHLRDTVSRPDYFDMAFENLFNDYLEAARAEQDLWWAEVKPDLEVCPEPVEQFADEFGFTGLYSTGFGQSVECYIDQFGPTRMPDQTIAALLFRMDTLIYAMQSMYGHYDYKTICYDPDTYEDTPDGTACDNAMVYLRKALAYQYSKLQADIAAFVRDTGYLAAATEDFGYPEWWTGHLGAGWSLNLPFVDPAQPGYGSAYDRPGAVYFDGYRRRPFCSDDIRYQEFPDEDAIYWDLAAFRSYFNSGPGDYVPCDWIGNPYEPFLQPEERTCSPVPGLGFAGTVRIGGLIRRGLDHLVMQRDRLYWFNRFGQLRFITSHNLENYIEIVWQPDAGDSEPLPENSHIDVITDAAGNVYRFHYGAGSPGLDHLLLYRIEHEQSGKAISYYHERQPDSGEWVLKTVTVTDEDTGISYSTHYHYQDERVLLCLASQGLLDCDNLNGFQSLLTKEVNPLGGTTEFVYHDRGMNDFLVATVPYVYQSGDVDWAEAYRVRPVSSVRKLTQSYRSHVLSEVLYPEIEVEELEDERRRTTLTMVEWDRVTQHTFVADEGCSQLDHMVRFSLANPWAAWGPFLGRWELIVTPPTGRRISAVLVLEAAPPPTLLEPGAEISRVTGTVSGLGRTVEVSSVAVSGNILELTIDGIVFGLPGAVTVLLEVAADEAEGTTTVPQGVVTIAGRRTAKPDLAALRWERLSDDPERYVAFLGDRLEESTYEYTEHGNLSSVLSRRGPGFEGNGGWVRSENRYEGSDLRVTAFGLPDATIFSDGALVHQEITYEYDSKYLWLVTHIGGDTVDTSIDYDHEHLKPGKVTQRDLDTGEEIVVQYSYDRYGNLEWVFYPLDRSRHNDYHEANGLESVILEKTTLYGEGEQVVEEFLHSTTGQLLHYKDPRGFETDYQYDAFGRPIHIESAMDVISYTYETITAGPLSFHKTHLAHAPAPADVTQPAYETVLTVESDPLNRVGALTAYRAGREATFSMEYDRRGRLYRTRREGRLQEQLHYDPLDRVVQREDARGGIWRTSYDDRLTLRFNELACAWGSTTKQPLRRITTTNPVGEETLYYVDSRDRLVITQKRMEGQPQGEGFEYETLCWRNGWDDRDLLVFERSPLDVARYYTYDGFQRLTGLYLFPVPAQTDPGPEPPVCESDDPDCSYEAFAYHADHQVATYTDGNGHTTVYQYNPLGRLAQEIDPVGRITDYTYAPAGNITEIRQGPRIQTFTYDPRGYLRTYRDAEHNLTAYEHSFYGELVRLTEGLDGESIDPENLPDPLPGGHTREWIYGLDGLEAFRDEEGNLFTWSYDRFGGLVESTEPRGSIATKSYLTNGAGDVIRVTDAENVDTVYKRDAMGRITSKIVAGLGLRYRVSYNSNGSVKSVTQQPGTAAEAVWRYAYDSEGRLTAIVSPEGKRWNYGYDPLGWLASESLGDPALHLEEWTYQYDKVGNLRFVTNPLGAATEYRYDAADRLQFRQLPYQNPESFTYHQDDQLIVHHDQNGNEEALELDRNGRLVKHSDQEGYTVEYSYSRRGFLDGISVYRLDDPTDRYDERYLYTPSGQLEAIQYPDGYATRFHYDPSGNLDVVTDTMELQTTYEYLKPHSYPTLITAPSGVVTQIDRDGEGRVTSVTVNPGSEPSRVTRLEYHDAQGEIWLYPPGWDEPGSGAGIIHYGFDGDRNLRTIKRPSGATMRFLEYDDAGRLLGMEDELGNLFRYHYNVLGELETRTINGEDNGESVVYRPDGKVESIAGLGEPRIYTYQPDGLPEAVSIDGWGHAIRGYYDNGRLRSIQYADGTEKGLLYNRWGLPDTIWEADAWTGRTTEITFAYDARGRSKVESTDGQAHQVHYYPNGLVKGIDDIHYDRDSLTGLLRHIERPGSPTIDFAYDQLGQRESVSTAEGFSETYGYYSSGRLKSIINNTAQITITYSADGHVDTVSIVSASGVEEIDYDYDAAGRLWRVHSPDLGDWEYEHDAAGNLVRITDLETGELIEKRDFDQFNRLQAYIRLGTEGSIEYDAVGNLVQDARADGVVRDFSFDDVGRLRALSVAGAPVQRLDYDAVDRLIEDASRILGHVGLYAVEMDAEVKQAIAPDPDTGLPAAVLGSDSAVIPTWLFGSAIQLNREDGSSLGRVLRSPYGVVLQGPVEEMPFGFKGYYQHAGSETHWAFARHYDGELRFFLSPDPLPGEVFSPRDMNHYGIFSSDPVGVHDYLGLSDVCGDLPCPELVPIPTGPKRREPRDIPPAGETGTPPGYSMSPEERLKAARENTRKALVRVNEGLREAQRRSQEWKEGIERAKSAGPGRFLAPEPAEDIQASLRWLQDRYPELFVGGVPRIVENEGLGEIGRARPGLIEVRPGIERKELVDTIAHEMLHKPTNLWEQLKQGIRLLLGEVFGIGPGAEEHLFIHRFGLAVSAHYDWEQSKGVPVDPAFLETHPGGRAFFLGGRPAITYSGPIAGIHAASIGVRVPPGISVFTEVLHESGEVIGIFEGERTR